MTDNTEALPPLEQQIDEYIDGYTLEGDDGYYTPNDTERLIAKDVVMGLLAEPWFVAALAAQQGAQVPLTELSEPQMLAIFREVVDGNTIKLTRDVGPYEVTEVTHAAQELVKAILRAARGIGKQESK